ncbi:uncharacterized protein IUM83_03310 [Phytophthora cinnamomi]|uniref:uncharacterized protein n=1 Tax=Phytophthora cinnamomi TaxID=4785 RepID=UPI00355A6D8F|nr:hypothetical protein IUM83_03310 [Phytophthora cinnamomi]
MYAALARLQERYAPVELLPAYCGDGICCVFAWVISTPLRNVGWAFGAQVWRVACLNGSLWNACLCQYNAVLLNREVRELRGAAYVYTIWGALFAVPVRVLEDEEEHYGVYGRTLHKWWFAAYSTFYAYLPDLGLSTALSVACYAKATHAAAAQSRGRAFEGLHVAWLVTKFVLSLAFFAPMAAFDLLESALLGAVGVTIALITLNAANYVLDWTPYGPPATVRIVTAGVVTHIWRSFDDQKDTDEFSPTGIIIRGLKDMRARAAERERSETESLQRLRSGGAVDDRATYGDAVDGVEVTIDE